MKFRQSAETFTVEELPLFEPSGRGDHVYLSVRRRDMSTPYLLKEIARRLRLAEEDLGCAGNKDRDAVAVQVISLPSRLERQASQALAQLGAEVLSARRHPHKLRTGKLAGNRFTLRLELEGAAEGGELARRCGAFEKDGMPNAFGPQRFADFSGVEEGRRLFLGMRPRGPFRKSRFAVSVFQALLFNEVLEARRERGLYPGALTGDVMKKHDTGGEFLAEPGEAGLEQRVRSLETSPTGPIFGGKMPWPQDRPLEIEHEILARHGLNPGSVSAARAPGARRFLRVPTGPIAVSAEGNAATLTFTLPPGSYASVLLAELGVDIRYGEEVRK